MVALALRHEQVAAAPAVEERLMQMPAAGVIPLERRPRHEGGEISDSAADLPRRRAEQQRMVGRLQRGPCGEGALELPGSPFVLDRSQRQSDLCEMIGECG